MQNLPPKKNSLEKGADKATRWIGSTKSLIVHTVLFTACFIIVLFGASLDRVLLILTTIVSLEAIYLAIFIQMTVNKNTTDIEEIAEDVEEIQEGVQEMERDVDEIQKDVDEIQEDIDEIQKDTDTDVPGHPHAQLGTDLIKDIEQRLHDLRAHIEELKNKN